MIARIKKSETILLIIIVVITFLAYSNTITNGFVIEDDIYIKNWKLTESLSNIPKMFAGDTAPTGNYGIYRPMRAVFYAISYKLWGTNPFLYHLQAILVHVAVTVLVFYTVRLILQGLSLAKERPFIAFVAALLFGLHPIHTEAVDYLTANFDAISYIFFFGSFYLYLRSRIDNLGYLVYLSYLAAALAFFSFEMTLTLPFLIVLYEVCFKLKSLKLLKSPKILKNYLPYFAIAAIFLFIRIVILRMGARSDYLEGSFYLTMLTMSKVVVKYLIMLIWPLDLSINPTLWGGINAWVHPLANLQAIRNQSIFDWDIVLGILGILGLLGAAVKLRKKFPLITFGILWFFISLLPVSYIIPQGTIFQERYIYIASFGFVLIVAVLLGRLGKLGRLGRLGILGSVVLLALFYGIVTFQRNMDWKNSYAVWTKLAKQTANDILANFSAAREYQVANQDDLALIYYNKILKLEQRLHEPHFAIGEIYLKQRKIDEAAVQFYQALFINPNYREAKEALEKLNNGYTSSESGKIITEDVWRECRLSDSLVFSCPKIWQIVNRKDKAKLLDVKSDFTIEISLDKKPDMSFDEYLKAQPKIGKLINQGQALIPNVDMAFVRVFEDKKVQKLQFFLIKGEKIVKILVYPGDSLLMAKFDRLVSSMRFLR